MIDTNDKIQDVERLWTVYIHTVPKELSGYEWDKRYIGITSLDVNKRWGLSGGGYKDQMFYNAIQKYGWDNIRHEIIETNLSQEEANKKEIELIAYYNSNNKLYGYNMTKGGDNVADSLCIPLACYNLDGDFITIFNSGIEASIHCNCKLSVDAQMSGGYMWRRVIDGYYPMKIEPYKEPYIVPVEKYSLRGEFIEEFISVKEAQRKYPGANISNACREDGNGTLTAAGFQWKRKGSDKKIIDITDNCRILSDTYYVYNYDGMYIGSYNSKFSAGKELGIISNDSKSLGLPNYIFNSIYNNYYYGYRWTKEFYEYLPPLLRYNNKGKPVVQIDLTTNRIINIFPSCKEAEAIFPQKTKRPHAINECCSHRSSTAHGYKWEFLENMLIEESEITDSFLLQKIKEFQKIINNKGGN